MCKTNKFIKFLHCNQVFQLSKCWWNRTADSRTVYVTAKVDNSTLSKIYCNLTPFYKSRVNKCQAITKEQLNVQYYQINIVIKSIEVNENLVTLVCNYNVRSQCMVYSTNKMVSCRSPVKNLCWGFKEVYYIFFSFGRKQKIIIKRKMEQNSGTEIN